MARSVQASGTNSMGPDFTYQVDVSANQLRVIMREGPDTITLLFDNRGQALEVLRDLMLQINAIGNNL